MDTQRDMILFSILLIYAFIVFILQINQQKEKDKNPTVFEECVFNLNGSHSKSVIWKQNVSKYTGHETSVMSDV